MAAAGAAVETGMEPMVAWGTLEWAIALTAGLCAVILVLVIVSRVLYRANQTEGTALWLNFLGLIVFPLFLLAVGNFTVLEYAKEVRFCGACHLTMKPYIDDLHNPKSQSLAALHVQHRVAPGGECYSCHADYGLHGTMEAKLTGLRHVFKYATGTYHLPLTMPTPFSNGLCLKCHEGAKRFMVEAIHLEGSKVSAELKSGKTECTQCHAPAHEIPKSRKAARSEERG